MQQQLHPASRRAHGGPFLQLQLLPPALRPLVRAYLLGYASAVAPRLLTLLVQRFSRRKPKSLPDGRPRRAFVESALIVLRTSCEPHRFPTFCALLVGGSTLLQVRPHLLAIWFLSVSGVSHFTLFLPPQLAGQPHSKDQGSYVLSAWRESLFTHRRNVA